MNNRQIYQSWVEAWNEDTSVLNKIAASDCTVHQARTDEKNSKSLKGAEALREIIQSAKHYFDKGKMSVVVGPIEKDGYISARWNYSGKYNGKMKEAKVENGKEISFSGIDIFHIENGRIKDYWVSSDSVDFMKQLEII